MKFGMSMPIVQQVPGRAQAWEKHAGPAELARVGREADRLGFAWITCSDHIAVPASYEDAMGATWYEPVATLGFLAGQTQRVRLLSHVLVLPYRHPLLVAKSFATLDLLSGGRVILGVGCGHLKPEFRSLGVAYEERERRMDEALRAVVTALEGRLSAFEGEFSTWRDMIVSPRAAKRPPIWVGGNGRAAIRRAVELAEGWIPWELTLERFAELAAYARARAAELERAAGLELVAPLPVAAEENGDALRRRIDDWTAAGATGFHLGLASRGPEHLLERMQWFASVMMPSA